MGSVEGEAEKSGLCFSVTIQRERPKHNSPTHAYQELQGYRGACCRSITIAIART
jgi:hypothetical protein